MERPAAVVALYSLLFFLGFGLTVAMLATDQNLRTDFGTVHSGYFSHWYVVAVAAGAELLGGVLLLAVRSRRAVLAGTVGSGLLALIFLADILTYREVGFASATAFANYLFGITYYGGDVRYLYDAVLLVFFLTFDVGVAILWRWSARSSPASPTPADGSPGPH